MRGNVRESRVTNPCPDIKVNIHNKFDVEVIDATTGEIKNKARGYNCVTKRLWNRLMDTFSASVGGYGSYNRPTDNNYTGISNYFKYLLYGSGSGTPSPDDTAMFDFKGALGPDGYGTWVSTKEPVYGGSYTRKFIMGITTGNGVRITEVGIGDGTATGSLCTHAMLQDMNGNPIAIDKTDTDIINFYATVYCEISVGLPDGSIGDGIKIIDSNAYIARQMCGAPDSFIGSTNMGFYMDDSNGMTAISCGMLSSKYAKGSSVSVDSENRKMTLRCGRFGVNDSNTGRGAIGLVWGTHARGYFDTYYSTQPFVGSGMIPIVTFDSRGSWWNPYQITDESIGTGDGSTVDFKTRFPFDTEMSIYVNGQRVNSDLVDIDYNVPETNSNVGRYFVRIFNDPKGMAANYTNTSPYGFSNASSDPHTDGNQSSDYPRETCNRWYWSGNHRSYWFNPFYIHGIKSVSTAGYGGGSIQASNDGETWVSIPYGNVAEDYQHYKYWSVGGCSGAVFNANDGIKTTNIHFKTPPREGDVITADYKTKMIPKDVDHVFDFEFSITFGEPDRDV